MSISSPPTGVGAYPNSASVNVASDAQLADVAWWLVHQGTVNDYRWPRIPVNMTRTEVQSLFYAIQDCDLGDYAEIINPPTWLPPDPVKQVITQTEETLGGFHFNITWACVPEATYETGLYDDATYGRADTDGSTLASSTYDTTVSAASPTAWWKLTDAPGTTTAADSSGNGHTGTATAVTFGNGALFNGTNSAILTSWNPTASAITVDGWVNLDGLTQSGNSRLIANSHTDSSDVKGFEVMLTSALIPQAWFGNGTTRAGVASISPVPTSGWTYLAATWDGATVSFYVNGVFHVSTPLSGSLPAGTASGIGLGYNPAYNGDYLNGQLSEWTVALSALSGAQIAARYAAMSSVYNSAATTLYVATSNPATPLWTTTAGDFPLDIAVDGERITVTNITGSSSPQTFTVTRSVNGVVKSHSSGADVRLWTPPVYARS